MGDIKLFANDDNELWSLSINNVQCVSKDIIMDFRLDTYATVTFMKRRITETHSLNVDFVKPLGSSTKLSPIIA